MLFEGFLQKAQRLRPDPVKSSQFGAWNAGELAQPGVAGELQRSGGRRADPGHRVK